MGVFNLFNMDGQNTQETADVNAIPATKDVTSGDVKVSHGVPEPVEGSTPEEKTIVLDGPLSHIYTQALNAAYAIESNALEASMMSVAFFKSLLPEEQEEASKEPYSDNTFVYCIDGNDLSDGLVEGFESLRQAAKVYKDLVVCIECGSVVNAKMQLMSEFSESLGAKVCYSRDNALKTVLSKVRKV